MMNTPSSILASLLCLCWTTHPGWGAAPTEPSSPPAMRGVMDLGGSGWKLWLDEEADYADDPLFLPPVDAAKLPVHLPGIGWEAMMSQGMDVSVPGTVEEYQWTALGDLEGKNRTNRISGTNPYEVKGVYYSWDEIGDYRGVSWWWRTFDMPGGWRDRHVRLQFDAVRQRAEVFLNRKLVGYDVIGNTPFEVDLTDHVKPGRNMLAVRITDPFGNYHWSDRFADRWGDHWFYRSHGFGGITGRLRLVATGRVYLDDVYLLNTPDPRVVELHMTICNTTDKTVQGTAHIDVAPVLAGAQGRPVDAMALPSLRPGQNRFHLRLRKEDAHLWSPDHPHLYRCTVRLHADMNGRPSFDMLARPFGFRAFLVREKEGERYFELNGRKIFLITAISWGFWPCNGIFPYGNLAEKQIHAAKSLGLNMLNFHRCIGQPQVMDAADRLGLMIYEEPGGYQLERAKEDPFARAVIREKINRMIRRDRSHPSLVMYNLINETHADPSEVEREDMHRAHAADPSRIWTYASGMDIRPPQSWRGPHPRKLHMLPWDGKQYEQGWLDIHHATSRGVYCDALYNGPDDHYLQTDIRDEIVYWGETCPVGAPPQLEQMEADILASGKRGWDGHDYLAWRKGWQQFLEDKDLIRHFGSVDALCRSFGDVALYAHGRNIENARIGGVADGYAINGWESEKAINQSGIVDIFRNPKGHVATLRHYTSPIYVAVKARTKVLDLPGNTVVDTFLINQTGLQGTCIERIQLVSPSGAVTPISSRTIAVHGGARHAQALSRSVHIPLKAPGPWRVESRLLKHGTSVAHGHEDVFVTAWRDTAIPPGGTYLDGPAGEIAGFLAGLSGSMPPFDNRMDAAAFCLIGNVHPEDPQARDKAKGIIRRLADAQRKFTCVVLGRADAWCQYFHEQGIFPRTEKSAFGTKWKGGGYFVRKHPIFDGLPVNTAMNWEYQDIVNYQRNRYGLTLDGEEVIVGGYSGREHRLFTVMGIRATGPGGRVIFSALDLLPSLNTRKIEPLRNREGREKPENPVDLRLHYRREWRDENGAVSRKIFCNLLEYLAD